MAKEWLSMTMWVVDMMYVLAQKTNRAATAATRRLVDGGSLESSTGPDVLLSLPGILLSKPTSLAEHVFR